jgi:hypothetical protein
MNLNKPITKMFQELPLRQPRIYKQAVASDRERITARKAGPLNLICCAATSAKCGLHVGNMNSICRIKNE